MFVKTFILWVMSSHLSFRAVVFATLRQISSAYKMRAEDATYTVFFILQLRLIVSFAVLFILLYFNCSGPRAYLN